MRHGFARMVIGLTGGIGCGKSTVRRFFAEAGARTVDTDDLVHDILRENAQVKGAIIERFGEAIQDAGEGIDRGRLGEIVFKRSEDLEWLESVLHPRVNEAWTAAVSGDPGALWLIEIPLLFEKNLEKLFKFTVCVSARQSVQWTRLERRGFSKDQIKARISRQLPLSEKVRHADFVISNNGTLTFLQDEVHHLFDQLRSL